MGQNVYASCKICFFRLDDPLKTTDTGASSGLGVNTCVPLTICLKKSIRTASACERLVVEISWFPFKRQNVTVLVPLVRSSLKRSYCASKFVASSFAASGSGKFFSEKIDGSCSKAYRRIKFPDTISYRKRRRGNSASLKR